MLTIRRMSTMSTELGPMGTSISSKVRLALSPTYLSVQNESHKHSVPKGSETHFKVICVSTEFQGKTLVERHRMINAVLDGEFKSGLHALSLVTKTPQQWEVSSEVPESPNCKGGSKKN